MDCLADRVVASVTGSIFESGKVLLGFFRTAQVAKGLMAFVIFLSFALQFYVPMEMITRKRKGKESKYENLVQVVIRTVMVTISVAIAAAFPNLELVISFVGAVFFSTLGLLIPAVVDTVYRWENRLGRFNYILWKNTLIGIVSIIALFSGAYVSIQGMIEDFGGHSLEHEAFENATLT
uniref:SFRICE_025371 n=1 Tax=Spodoptera frugiperda TaxID=7108 RepID=A0A2H1VHK2_SPOFR